MTRRKIGVLVSGRGSNLAEIIRQVQAGRLPLEIAAVISDQPTAPALSKAESAGIPNFTVARSAFAEARAFELEIERILKEQEAELVVLAGFMRILSGAFVSGWHGRIINIHPALLPSFPGLDAQGQAVRYGVKVSGCTVHFVDEGMDTGPIILQRAVPVLHGDTADTLAQRILEQEHEALPAALALWAADKLVIQGRTVSIKQ